MTTCKHIVRGARIYYTDGELAFENAIYTKADVGTHVGIFLEEMDDQDSEGNIYSKILNVHDKIEIVPNSLISLFNI